MNDQVARPTGLLVSASVLATISTAFAIRLPTTLAKFEQVFKPFGADLPALTRLVLAAPYSWWLFAGLSALLATWTGRRNFVSRDELHKMKLALRLMLVATALAFGVIVYALYLPVFMLGPVV